jgi:hypothetical protein
MRPWNAVVVSAWVRGRVRLEVGEEGRVQRVQLGWWVTMVICR